MFAVSLLVHALLWILMQNASFGFLVPRPSVDQVEIVLADDPPLEVVPVPSEMADEATPRQITLMPERLAGEEPGRADFLADVSSRAADLVPGGEAGAQPRASRESDVQAVQIREETTDEGTGVEVTESVMPPPQPATRPRTEPVEEDPVLPSDAAEHGDEPLAEPQEQDETVETAPDERADGPESDYEDWASEQRAPSLLDPGERAQGDRGFEFDQAETGNIETNVDIVGGYRLSTYAWNFAPWIRRFANDLQRAWIPPYAYRLGLIDGRTEVRVVVERDGRPSRMDVLSGEGHESLHTASVSALKASAPYLPLPPDFPQEKLVIVFTLIYPEWRR
jgi:outer membrane biosynthesis protein TonB